MNQIIKLICIGGCRMLGVVIAILAVDFFVECKTIDFLTVVLSLFVLFSAVVAYAISYVVEAAFIFLEERNKEKAIHNKTL